MTAQTMPWRATALTLFPDWFPGPLGASLAGDALMRGLWTMEPIDIRTHGLGRHRAVDDTPAGGGAGMVLRADVLATAIDAAVAPDDPRPRILLSPRGRPLTQARVRGIAAGPGVVLLCGRFEGVDERVIAARALEEVSIGDYVLSGGELAAMVLLDACVRLLPGVMGAEASAVEESFEGGLLEYPHYTRPRLFEGRSIPEVLLSGDHKRIAAWRHSEAETLTRRRRPDLHDDAAVSDDLATVYRAYIACLNRRDWPALGQFVDDDARYNGERIGLSGYRAMLERDVRDIPDLHFAIDRLIADPPYIASRLAFSCSPRATFLGLPVNGKTVSFSENVFYRFKGGKIIEVWSVIDKAAIEAQL